jgi:hypothetical protein
VRRLAAANIERDCLTHSPVCSTVLRSREKYCHDGGMAFALSVEIGGDDDRPLSPPLPCPFQSDKSLQSRPAQGAGGRAPFRGEERRLWLATLTTARSTPQRGHSLRPSSRRRLPSSATIGAPRGSINGIMAPFRGPRNRPVCKGKKAAGARRRPASAQRWPPSSSCSSPWAPSLRT